VNFPTQLIGRLDIWSAECELLQSLLVRFHHAILKASVLWTRLQKYSEKAKQAGAQFSYIRLYKLYELEYHLTKILLEIQ
jgi:hypothetical protein